MADTLVLSGLASRRLPCDDDAQSPLTFGINCVRCKDELIAPERSEYRLGTQIRHLWYCSNCEASFESLESIPAEALTTDDIFSSALVA
jgi:hypothetical protein